MDVSQRRREFDVVIYVWPSGDKVRLTWMASPGRDYSTWRKEDTDVATAAERSNSSQYECHGGAMSISCYLTGADFHAAHSMINHYFLKHLSHQPSSFQLVFLYHTEILLCVQQSWSVPITCAIELLLTAAAGKSTIITTASGPRRQG
jgi:hypothetical protein